MLGRLQSLARDERAHERLDQPRLLARNDAEDRELVVPAVRDPLVVLARQHRLDMPRAKALSGAIDRRQQLLREHRRIDLSRRIEANVAITAAFGRMLAEMAQQQGAAAFYGLDQDRKSTRLNPSH